MNIINELSTVRLIKSIESLINRSESERIRFEKRNIKYIWNYVLMKQLSQSDTIVHTFHTALISTSARNIWSDFTSRHSDVHESSWELIYENQLYRLTVTKEWLRFENYNDTRGG